MSDHGTAIGSEERAFANLLAIRAPGHPDVLDDDATLIEVLPRIFNTYLGGDFTIPPPSHFRSPGLRLDLIPWP